jgi:alpha-glucosidase
MRRSISDALAAHAPVDAPATWVLSNHDVTRPVTRYGRTDTAFAFEAKRVGTPTNLARGTRRARAAALLAMALPGSMYIYQGEELGLPEVEDIPDDRRQDPMWLRSGGVDPGRDGCRVPLPWAGHRPPYGFSAEGAGRPWLDQPDDWATLTVAAQSETPASMLALYRAGLRERGRRPWGESSELTWIAAPESVVAFARGHDFACVVNFGPGPVQLPAGAAVLLTSDDLEGGALPQDTTVWLRQAKGQVPFGDTSLRAAHSNGEVNERERR